jgi:hypothetical protein
MVVLDRPVLEPRAPEARAEDAAPGMPLAPDELRSAGEPSDEAASLARLADHERKLDRRLDEARREANALLADARRQAEAAKREAEATLAEELERLRRDHAQRLGRSLAAIRDQTAARCAEVRQRAARNRERVLDFLLACVAGKDAP